MVARNYKISFYCFMRGEHQNHYCDQLSMEVNFLIAQHNVSQWCWYRWISINVYNANTCFITRKPLQQHPISDMLGAESMGGHEKYQGHCGVIYEWYTQNVTILSATPPRGGCYPLTLTQKNKESFIYSQLERSSNRLDNVAPVWWSYILSCCEYLEDSLLFWVGVVGRQPLRGRGGHRAQPLASDNIVTDSVEIIHIFFLTISLVPFTPSPAIRVKNARV